MIDPTEPPQHSHDADPGWEEAVEEVTVLTVPEKGLPKAVVPLRRAESEGEARRSDGGLRIEPRVFTTEPRKVTVDDELPLEVNRIGEGVVRLESSAPEEGETSEAPRPVMQERVSRKERGEVESGESWGGGAKQSHRWMFWGAAGVLVAVVGGWSIQSFLAYRAQPQVKIVTYGGLEVVKDVAPPPKDTSDFSENVGEVDRSMRQTLSAYAQAKTLDEVLPLVRHGAAIRPLLEKHWKSWSAPAGWAPTDEAASGYSSIGGLSYGTIAGIKPDYSSYRAYFVRENGKMLVDWEATVGYSDHLLSELSDRSIKESMVRALVSPATYYSVAFPESDYMSYRLASPTDDGLVWAYARRESPAAKAVSEALGENSIFLERPGEMAMRLRLARGPDGAMANQWLILDVLHNGWVSP